MVVWNRRPREEKRMPKGSENRVEWKAEPQPHVGRERSQLYSWCYFSFCWQVSEDCFCFTTYFGPFSPDHYRILCSCKCNPRLHKIPSTFLMYIVAVLALAYNFFVVSISLSSLSSTYAILQWYFLQKAIFLCRMYVYVCAY